MALIQTRRLALFVWLAALVAAMCVAATPMTGEAAPTAIAAPPPNLVDVGRDHACAVAADATLWCWGDNFYGQLGDGTEDDHTAPAQVAGLTAIAEVASGTFNSCARSTGGQVWCWGSNAFGQLGDGGFAEQLTPQLVAGLTGVSSVTLGQRHACAVDGSGQAWCWGNNDSGEVGDGSQNDAPDPMPVVGVSDALSVSAGGEHTCALREAGVVTCWGQGDRGALGNGIFDVAQTDVTVALPLAATDVVSGDKHTCASLVDGNLWCWGDGQGGAIGNGNIGIQTLPAHTPLDAPVVVGGLAAGESLTCAALLAGTTSCWGSGYAGGLGNGSMNDSAIPVTVSDLVGALDVASGDGFACATTVGGSLWCWGHNRDGKLGAGLAEEVRSPVQISGVSDATRVVAGRGFSCALRSNGAVACWGGNEEGQLGRGATGGYDATAGDVVGVTTATDIDGFADHACALLTDATMRCWGSNAHGQLGDATSVPRATPVLTGLADVRRIAVGGEHTCARTGDGAVYCWGENSSGQLGDGTFDDHTTPHLVPGSTNGGQITAGAAHTCARLANDEVWCWGDNAAGQIGDGSQSTRTEPTEVVVANNSFLQVDAGGEHTCAARVQHVWCWGSGSVGQLGTGSISDELTPVEVSGTGTGLVSAGGLHTCVLHADRTVTCWGNNSLGQLGDGTGVNHISPTDITGLTEIADIDAGDEHTCAVRTDGTVWCWGANWGGQLGDLPWSTVPRQVPGIAMSVPPVTHPLLPARLLDTRPGQTTVDGLFAGVGRQSAGATLELQVGGRGGVPVGAAAAVVNVTSVFPDTSGFVTVYACDEPRPLASSVNDAPGGAVPNEVVAKLSSTGTVCLYTLAGTDLVVDVTGWTPPVPTYVPLVPARLLDTRPGEPTVDGLFAGVGRQLAGATLELQVGGRGGVADDAAAAVVNVTSVFPDTSGFVTVFPCDEPLPVASTLNVAGGGVVANEVVARLSASGTICLYTLGATDLVVDVTGWIPDTVGFVALVPGRLLDTRQGQPTIDGSFAGLGRRAAGTTLELQVSGRGGVPGGATAAVVNVTGVFPDVLGFVTVFPCDAPQPLASSLNVTPGRAVPNEVVAKLSAAGTICLFTSTAVDLVVDVSGALS